MSAEQEFLCLFDTRFFFSFFGESDSSGKKFGSDNDDLICLEVTVSLCIDLAEKAGWTISGIVEFFDETIFCGWWRKTRFFRALGWIIWTDFGLLSAVDLLIGEKRIREFIFCEKKNWIPVYDSILWKISFFSTWFWIFLFEKKNIFNREVVMSSQFFRQYILLNLGFE